MITINSVIARVDAVKVNTYTAEEKARWLIELDGRIYREIFRCFGDYPVSEYPRDGDKELLVSSPYDVIYDYYLFAMIDFHNRETDNYANSFAMFNEKFTEFAKAWQRQNRPKDGGVIDTMGWASSSALGEELTVDDKIWNHDNEHGSHPYILQMIKQRYEAMSILLEQYRSLVDGTATDDDIKRLIAEHNRSQYAHQDLFNEVQATIDEHTSARNNPHRVTAAQIGAVTEDDMISYVGNVMFPLQHSVDDLLTDMNFKADKSDLSDYVPQEEFQLRIEPIENDINNIYNEIGDIESALDELHSYAQNLVGGDA